MSYGSDILEHAKRELAIAPWRTDEDRDAIMNALHVLINHYKPEAGQTFDLYVLSELMNMKTLSPLTDNPAEWRVIASSPVRVWGNIRRPDAISFDEGKTYIFKENATTTRRFLPTEPHNAPDEHASVSDG